MNNHNTKIRLQDDISGHVLKKCDYVFVYNLYTKFIDNISDMIIHSTMIYDYYRELNKFYILDNIIIQETLDRIYED